MRPSSGFGAFRRIQSRSLALADQARMAPVLRRMRNALAGAEALEIGGPSVLFGAGRPLAVYPRIGSLDLLDFATQTLWSPSSPTRGVPSVRSRMAGEASALSWIDDASYDAVLASHVLEHLANPIAALSEWRRVLRSSGHLLLVVPHRDGTFDHRRPVTSLTHMREDAARGIGEDDLTHADEVIAMHDHVRHPVTGGPAALVERTLDNMTNRAMHHHVFVTRTVLEVVEEAGFTTAEIVAFRPYHIALLATRDGITGTVPAAKRARLARSPFKTDQST